MLRLSELKNKTKTILVGFKGEQVSVTYLVNPITQNSVKQLESDNDVNFVIKSVALVVKDWDLMASDTERVDVKNVEALAEVPIEFLSAVLEAIVADKKGPGPEEKK
jgi:hypothetical protein